jgi:hypothetical protein
MKLPIQMNTLEDRNALMKAFCQLLEPIEKYYDKKNTQLSYGHTGSRTNSRTAAMEGLLRPLWGLIPATVGGLSSDYWLRYQEAVRYGTDPDSEYYWGDIGHSDQKMVEVASLGLALALSPEKLWEPLSAKERQNFAAWMNQINKRNLPDNNWRFFIVMVNLGLKKVGAEYDPKRLEDELVILESFYLSEGWYSDGLGEQRDYYVSFAMHFYGLIYSKIMREEDPQRSLRLIERGKTFAQEFIYWFGEEGDALPFGRSLTYRFAQAAFWSALAYADVEVFSWGVMKGLVLRHLRNWFKQDIFDSEGMLSIGYSYENLLMAEGYNAAGSTYWAMKTFLVLALDETHPFWQSEEEPLPKLKAQVLQKHPHMIVCREVPGHFAAFTSGQYAAFEPAHMEAKYEKFVYSNHFGFSVPKGAYGLEQGAYDNMLALSEQDEYYRVRHNSDIVKMEEDQLVSCWYPWKDVKVTTWLIAGLPWHLRIHHIETERPLTLAEGGFAVGCESRSAAVAAHIAMDRHQVMVSHEDGTGISAIYDLMKEAEAICIQPEANTNLCNPRTYLPTLKKNVGKGEHWLISAVYGSTNTTLPCNPPSLIRNQDVMMCFQFGNKDIIINKETKQVEVVVH